VLRDARVLVDRVDLHQVVAGRSALIGEPELDRGELPTIRLGEGLDGPQITGEARLDTADDGAFRVWRGRAGGVRVDAAPFAGLGAGAAAGCVWVDTFPLAELRAWMTNAATLTADPAGSRRAAVGGGAATGLRNALPLAPLSSFGTRRRGCRCQAEKSGDATGDGPTDGTPRADDRYEPGQAIKRGRLQNDPPE
jgi:hypothetical protein